MAYETIRLESAGRVATIVLERPKQRNAISVAMVEELEQALDQVEDCPDWDVLVLRGAGDMFSGGIDLRDFPADEKPDVRGFARWERVLRILERLPKITLAAVDGECAGGGLQLLLACDVRVATDRSFFHLHEARMGFLPGMATFRLAKFIGLGRARRMALTGRRVDADEAQRIGLIDHRCDAGDLDSAVLEAIDEFGPFRPEAIELIRRLLDESFEFSYEDFIGNFLAAQHRAAQTEAFRAEVARAHESDAVQGDDESE